MRWPDPKLFRDPAVGADAFERDDVGALCCRQALVVPRADLKGHSIAVEPLGAFVKKGQCALPPFRLAENVPGQAVPLFPVPLFPLFPLFHQPSLRGVASRICVTTSSALR